MGNVLTIADAAANGGTQTFTYDALDRLATAAASGGYGAYPQQRYEYASTGNITAFGALTNTLFYNDTAHKHAVTHVGGTQKYWYDANGNATKRIGEDGVTYEFVYDFENRVTQLKKNGAVISAFKYDGDGNRIVETTGGVTTAYLGNYYEWTSSGAKSYYYAGNARIAMRDSAVCPNTGVCYLLGDHLGSTSVTVFKNGTADEVARQWYHPFGSPRANVNNLSTDRRFTGQRSEEDALGSLYDFVARPYSPALGRFLAPDSIIPEPGNPQALNRYSYGLDNPIKYTDPSGHNPIVIAAAAAAGPIGLIALAAAGGCMLLTPTALVQMQRAIARA